MGTPRVRTRLALLAATLALGACSLVSLGYSRLPDLTVWWLQRQVSLDSAQTAQARQDMQAVMAWHRRTHLPELVDMLQHWQRLVDQPLTAEQACGEFDKVRTQWTRLMAQSAPGMVTLAKTLTPAQRDELKTTQAKSQQTFRQTYLAADAGASSNRLFINWTPSSPTANRLSNLKDRYARLYGELNTHQVDALRRSIDRSSFDPGRTLAERERRHQDLTSTLDAVNQAANPADAQRLVQAWVNRLSHSPTPGYTAYSQALVREACEQFTQVHAGATADQRLHARRVMAGYEADLRQLMANP